MDANNEAFNYGSGRKVATVNSVILPPQKLKLNYDFQEWVQRETNEVCSMADDLFSEVSKALHEILEKITVNNGAEAQDSCQQIAELERILKEERMEFEELLGKMLHGEDKDGQTVIDILEINHLRRQLVLYAYSWEQHLLQIANSHDRDSLAASSSHSKDYQVFHSYSDQDPGKNLLDTLDAAWTGENQSDHSYSDQDPGKNFLDTLDAAWTGESQSASKKSSAFLESLLHQAGVRLLLPLGINNKVVPVYEDEPSSIISYALLSPDYHVQMSDESEKVIMESSASESTKEGVSSSLLDPLFYTSVLHTSISFSETGPEGKPKYKVTCYYAKQFEALRKACCISELDFIRSLSRCTKCDPQGSKNSTFHAKTLDKRFIIKEVTKKELESFIMFAPSYFKYLSESIASSSPTCLAKIFGIYQITSKNLIGGKESKMEVLVMENLMLGHNITRMYELKGSSEPQYKPDPSENSKVQLDQNLVEAMPTSPIYVGSKAKKLLERAAWNDTAFLASVDVMEYSLLVGFDDEKHELVVGMIDYMRQYTWDKQLEAWVKRALGVVLGGTKNASPAVISPIQYKKKFREAISGYFIMVPDEESQ